MIEEGIKAIVVARKTARRADTLRQTFWDSTLPANAERVLARLWVQDVCLQYRPF